MSWLSWVGVAVVGFIALKFLFWRFTKYMIAQNVVQAAITYRTLDFGQMGGVDGTVTNICWRLNIREELIDSPLVGGNAVRYAFRSLAMREMEIAPADDAFGRWYILRNPFNAMLCQKEIAKCRRRYEKKHGLELKELDPEPFDFGHAT